MFKKVLIILVASIFAIGAFASMDAFAHGKKHKNHFKIIWQKLIDHEERISDLEEQLPLAISTRVVTEDIIIPDYETLSVSALCNEEESLTGGGFEQTNEFGATPMYILSNGPVIDDIGVPIGWEAISENRTNRDQTLSVYAICASSGM